MPLAPRAATVAPAPRADPPPDLTGRPLYLLAVLCSAGRSKGHVLERITRRRLTARGVRVTFADERPAAVTAQSKGVGRG